MHNQATVGMGEAEMARREDAATRDIAATAMYHANRLPAHSDLRQPLLRIAGALPTAPEVVSEQTAETPAERPALRVV